MKKTAKKTYGGFLISKVKQIQGRVFEKLLSEYGIEEFNGAQGRILFVLWENDNIPIRRLSEETGLAKTTLTSMLDRLEKSGYIVRSFDKSDRRTVKILLTEKAREMKSRYDLVSEKMSEIFYEGFSDEEILAFEEALGKILENLTKNRKDQNNG